MRIGSAVLRRIFRGYAFLLRPSGTQRVLSPCLIAIGLLAAGGTPAADPPSTVRVGVIASEGKFQDWKGVLQRVGREARGSLEFEVAIGTYADLLHWMEEGWIDVAVLSPALFVMSQGEEEYPRAATEFEYVATIGYEIPGSILAKDRIGSSGYRHHYHSVCVVSQDSPYRSFEDLVDANGRGDLLVVFGHPLSTSGRIAPEWALRRRGLVPHPDRVEYAHSHSNALRLLVEKEAGPKRVAFVYDGALESVEELGPRLRVLDIPELDGLELPWDVIVARRDLMGFDSLSRLILNYRDPQGRARFRRFEDWRTQYGATRRWAEAIGFQWDPQEGLHMSLGEIGEYLEHSARTQPLPPKIAVVLSGGGAKCAYQVGAMGAIEEELRALNRRNPENRFRIDLVVGTSGGAINALPTALGITADSTGLRDFVSVWESLDQREIIQFARSLRASIGLWLGILRITILVLLLKLLVRRQEIRAWWLGGILVAVGLIESLLHLRMRLPMTWLGDNHVLHHLWLWVSQGHDFSVVLLTAVGVGILVAQAVLRSRGSHLHWPARTLGAWVLLALIALPLVTGYHLLFGEETLSEGKGVERALSRGMSFMIGRHAERVTGKPLTLTAEVPSERLHELSGQIHGRSLLQRDLVITGTCLEQSGSLLPDDLYFYLRSEPSKEPSPLGHRGISLAGYPDRLLEVVVGSGSIFPLFPPRTLSDFPEPGQQVQLIDGGFAHNSPIEAAVLWGATHVILIEASPERSGRGSGLAANIVAAAEHYARQTQQVDQRSRKEVVVFTLSPEPPHPCLLDFSKNFIRDTIDKGYRDARGARPDDPRAVARRRFVKQPGRPVFAAIPAG